MYVTSKQPDLLLEPQKANLELLKEAIDFVRSTSNNESYSDVGRDAIDCCGTGGSGRSKFNYSTTCAFILASTGQRVVKFGNRSNTGNTGSQDFLDQLGFSKEVSIEKLYEKTNLAFLNAPSFYPELKVLARKRKKLKRATILNFIGPLLNPCKPQFRLLGVSNAKMQSELSKLLQEDISLEKALVVRSNSGLDELDPKDKNRIYEVDNKSQKSRVYNLSNIDFVQIDNRKKQLSNAETFFSIINGEDTTSETFKTLVLNAAAGLMACRRVSGIEEGVEHAQYLLKEGFVKNKFDEFRSTYNAIA